MPGAFDRPLRFSLTARAIAAALARVDFATVGQKLRKRIDIFVVNIRDASSAEAALSLLSGACKGRFSPALAVSRS